LLRICASSFLDKACCSDVALRGEVESLLLAGEGVRTGFLQSAPPDALWQSSLFFVCPAIIVARGGN
jgi:hypothetical protein